MPTETSVLDNQGINLLLQVFLCRGIKKRIKSIFDLLFGSWVMLASASHTKAY